MLSEEEAEQRADEYYSAIEHVVRQGKLIAQLNHEGEKTKSLEVTLAVDAFMAQFTRMTREALVYAHNLAWRETQKELEQCASV